MKKEIFDKVSACNSVDEILELAKANNKEITREEAERAYEITHNQCELSDDEIANISGGSGGCGQDAYDDVYYKTEAECQYIFNINDRLEMFKSDMGNSTRSVIVVDRKKESENAYGSAWCDKYQLRNCDNGELHSGGRYYHRSAFKK